MQKQSSSTHEFIDGIKLIESNIEDIANGTAPSELYEYTQSKIDKLAERFQHDESLGKSRYKLYELQALLFYFQHRDSEALDFINSAVELRGRTYDRAEELIGQINREAGLHSVGQHALGDEYNDIELPLQAQELSWEDVDEYMPKLRVVQHIGLLLAWFQQSKVYTGRPESLKQEVVSVTILNLVFGWWSIVSLIINPFVSIRNWLDYHAYARRYQEFVAAPSQYLVDERKRRINAAARTDQRFKVAIILFVGFIAVMVFFAAVTG